MAESICRNLRDGALEGEHAPALSIKDSIATPFGSDVFNYVLTKLSSNILAGKSQSKISILDCYTDPLGWKDSLKGPLDTENFSLKDPIEAVLFRHVRNLDLLLSAIIEMGEALARQGKGRFSVSIDSVTEMLRHASLSSVANLLSKVRSHASRLKIAINGVICKLDIKKVYDQNRISSTFWLLHSDLHEIRAIAALEYLSSMVGSLEPMNLSLNGQRGDLEKLSLLEQNSRKGKFHVRFKRRNGRVRVMCEDFHIKQSGINFTPVSSEEGIINQGLLPKVQFNLQLSEKERIDRAKVVLPFEHQGNGEPMHIYDGRRSLSEGKDEKASVLSENLQTNENSGKGEIIYFRDSDDEMPDSDEDPDDDLDI
uniref:Elongator complex protein 5 n=1 Tax=Vitis vinifera TaxID=29760 RepID=A5AFR0_VITVI|nr:hypothetical protein VITISV_011366 [Vitis vinifera]